MEFVINLWLIVGCYKSLTDVGQSHACQMCALEHEDLALLSNRDDDINFTSKEKRKHIILMFISNKDSQDPYTPANMKIMIRFFPE
jgi:hypothetical protein